MPDFAGLLYNDAGVPRDLGADTIAIFTTATAATETTGTGSATALTQTDALGAWSSLAVADGLYDVRITDGSSVRWRRYADRVQLREIWVEEFQVVNQTDGVSNQLLLLRGNNATRAANDEIYVSFQMDDSGGGITEFGRISVVGTTVTATSEEGRIDFAVMTAGTLADEVQITGTATAPSANDGQALGTTLLGWADLFLATGGVINWNNGEVVLTETDANTLTLTGVTLFDVAAGILELNDAVRFDTGVAMVAGAYALGRDADGTNQLHLNVPTGATLEFSVNDVAQAVLGASSLTGNVVGTGSSQVAQGSHTAPAASLTAAGHAEIATSAEMNTGTDATRTVSPDGLAGSVFGEVAVQLVVFDFATDVATGDGKFYLHIDDKLAGMDLVRIHGECITAGTTGTMDVQIANVDAAVDMLSTKLTWDSTETGTDTAATAAVINAANDDVQLNEVLRVDVDAVQTTKAKGMMITLVFRLP